MQIVFDSPFCDTNIECSRPEELPTSDPHVPSRCDSIRAPPDWCSSAEAGIYQRDTWLDWLDFGDSSMVVNAKPEHHLLSNCNLDPGARRSLLSSPSVKEGVRPPELMADFTDKLSKGNIEDISRHGKPTLKPSFSIKQCQQCWKAFKSRTQLKYVWVLIALPIKA